MLVLLALACLLPAASQDSQARQALPVTQHFTEAEWQARDAEGFTIAPSLVDSKTLPDNWQKVSLPHAPSVALLRQATEKSSAALTRTVWYRMKADIAQGSAPLALYAPRIRADGPIAVYVDGHLVQLLQPQGPLWSSSRTPLWLMLEKTADGSPPREILVRLEHSRVTRITLSSFWLGPVDDISWRHTGRVWSQQEVPRIFTAAFLAVGVFALLVWALRRYEAAYLLFFTLSVLAFIRSLHFYVDYPIANNWFAWLSFNSLFWLVTVVHLSLNLLHGVHQRWLTRTLIVSSVLLALLTLPFVATLPNTPKVTPILYVMAALMGTTVGMAGVLNGWKRSREAVVVSVGVLIATLLGLSDWLLQNNFISPESWYLGAYTNAVTFSVFGYVLYRRYTGAIEEVKEVNASLARRVKEREAELELSHRRLREVEQRQMLSDERQRMMQDMHDGLGSTLISAIRSVEGGGMSDERVSQILKDCMDDLKLAIDSMEPVEADLLLLLATLRFRLEPRLEGTGVALLWEVQELPPLDWLDPSSGLHILRIVQESVANILRHTRASEIRVATRVDGEGVQVAIEDNGGGFDVDKTLASGSGKGLQNQLRRAQSIQGRVGWTSGPGGTRFTLWLPLKRTAAAPSNVNL